MRRNLYDAYHAFFYPFFYKAYSSLFLVFKKINSKFGVYPLVLLRGKILV